MRVNAVVAGVGMTPFGKHLDKSLKWLAGTAVTAALHDAGLAVADVEAVYSGNCVAGLVTGQESIRGQVALLDVGLGRVPIINIENACGSGSTAMNQAAMMVSAGYYDVDQLLFYVGGIGPIHSSGMANCPAIYAAAHEQADGYPDPKTGRCTALSSAFNFSVVSAFIVHPQASPSAGTDGWLQRVKSYLGGLFSSLRREAPTAGDSLLAAAGR